MMIKNYETNIFKIIYIIYFLFLINNFYCIFSFDVDYYINKYPDVPKDLWGPFIHYLHHGFYEKRECAEPFKNTNFDWQYYVKLNNLDINSEIEAKEHYKKIGKLKNLDYCKKFKIGILLHLHNLNLMNEFIDKINYFMKINKLNDFCIVINVPISNYIYNYRNNLNKPDNDLDAKKLNKILSLTPYHKYLINSENCILLHNIFSKLKTSFNTSKKNIKIIFSENRGADIGGLLLSLDQIFKRNLDLDYIVKLHTKTDYVWREILTSILNIKINNLLHYYQYIGTCKICSINPWSYDLNIISHFKSFLSYFNLPLKIQTFHTSGAMFITSFKMFDLLKKFDLIFLFNELNSGSTFHEIGTSIEHFWEVFLGYLVDYYNLNYKIIGYKERKFR